jgi:hypothetical protein
MNCYLNFSDEDLLWSFLTDLLMIDAIEFLFDQFWKSQITDHHWRNCRKQRYRSRITKSRDVTKMIVYWAR